MKRLIYILYLLPLLSIGQIVPFGFMAGEEDDPYTAGTNLITGMNTGGSMTGDRDDGASTNEVEGNWTLSNGGSWSSETTTVRSGTTSLKYSSTGGGSDRIQAFGWNPPGQAAGKDWRWEGYVYVPSASSGGTLFLRIQDNNGNADYDIDESLTDQWVFFSFDFSQTTTNTFKTFIIWGDADYYLDDMIYLDVTP